MTTIGGRDLWRWRGFLIVCGFLMAGNCLAQSGNTGSQNASANESSPVRIGDLEFVVATQVKWIAYKGTNTPIRMELRITNRGTKNVIFPTMDTSGPRITMNGNELRMQGGRSATMPAPPIGVEPGKTIVLTRQVSLSRSTTAATRAAARFTYADDTGLGLFIDPLAPGAYQLRFWLEAAKPDLNDHSPFAAATKNGATWVGKGETEAVTFSVELK